MGSKRRSNNIPLSLGDLQRARAHEAAQQLIGLLKEQLAAATKREFELLRQLSAKDDQIRMVLEEKYFKPVTTRTEPPAVSTVAINPADLADTTQFSAEGDKEAIAKQEEEETKARQEFETNLAVFEKDHAEPGEPTEEEVGEEISAT